MKTKKFDKKLVLNKETIADVTRETMRKVQGGDNSSPITCVIYCGPKTNPYQTCPYTICFLSMCPDSPC